jgi:hypothetical protein
MLTLLVIVILAWVVWRLIRGLVRWVLWLALGAFLIFFLWQPTSVPAATRAKTAAHAVVSSGRTLAHATEPRWQHLVDTVTQWVTARHHPAS